MFTCGKWYDRFKLVAVISRVVMAGGFNENHENRISSDTNYMGRKE